MCASILFCEVCVHVCASVWAMGRCAYMCLLVQMGHHLDMHVDGVCHGGADGEWAHLCACDLCVRLCDHTHVCGVCQPVFPVCMWGVFLHMLLWPR